MHLFRFLGVRRLHQRMTGLGQNASIQNYDLQRVLLVVKTTRLEAQPLRFSSPDDKGLRETLKERGSEYLIRSHKQHKAFEKKVIECLEKMDVEVKTIDRYAKPHELIDWADTVMSIGGDGTFLMAANKVGQSKPLIGLNSCPERSTGYLCLPKEYSADVCKTLMDIKQRRFSWAYRTRIRVTLTGKNLDKTSFSLHDKYYQRKSDKIENYEEQKINLENAEEETLVLPCLALNEVFIAESVPATVSYLDISVNGNDFITTKNSGISVCTGSGSSSWNYTMNRISEAVVQKLFSISGYKVKNIEEIVEKYNNSLKFNADDQRMDYTIRDMIPSPTWPKMPDLPYKGSTNCMRIRSQCRNGTLVIDGGCTYNFNSGVTALLETFPEDMLRTIKMN